MHTVFLFPAPCLPSNSSLLSLHAFSDSWPFSDCYTHMRTHTQTPLPNLQSPAIVAYLCMHLEVDSLLGGLPLEKMNFSSLSSRFFCSSSSSHGD